MKRWMTLALVVGLIGLSMAGCGKKPQAASADKSGTAVSETPNVRTGKVTETVGDDTLAVTGNIEAQTDVVIASKIMGRVTALGADEGQSVPAGRVLISLDASAAAADLRRAEAMVVSARASLNKAMISVSLIDTQTDAAVRTAQAQVNAAKARRSQAESSYRLSQTKSGDKGVDVQQANAALQSAQNRLVQAQQTLLIQRQKTTSDVESSEAAVEQANTALASARTRQTQAETSLSLTDTSTQNAVANAAQAVSQAQYQVAILQEGSRSQEKGTSESAVLAATAALRTAEADYSRAKRLFDGGAIAKASLDNTQLILDTRREQLKQAQLQASLVNEGPRQQQIQIAQSQFEQAKDSLSQARSNRDSTLSLRRDDVAAAKQDVVRYEQMLRSSNAALLTARAAKGQVPISEQDVANAEQAVETSKQAVRLAEAGVNQTEIAGKELEAAGEAVSQAEQGLRNAVAGRVQPSMTRQDIQQLRGALAQAEAGASFSRATLRDHSIVAPISGSIAEKAVEVGSVVNPGVKLFRLVSEGYVNFKALVPEEKLRFVNAGDTVDVAVDAQPNEKYVGRVLEILPSADVRSRSFTLKIGIANLGGKLKEGMFARGSVVVQRNKRTLKVPVSALVRRDDRNWVVKLEGSRAVPAEVVIGSTREGMVEIADGSLQPGDQIVTEGAAEITKETTVKVLAEGGTDAGGAKGGPEGMKGTPPGGKGGPPATTAEKSTTK